MNEAVEREDVRFMYRNYRNEIAERHVTPISMRFGSTVWHPEPQWLLRAYDHCKKAEREFALSDCQFAALDAMPAVSVKPLEWITPSPTTDGQWQDTTGIYDIEECILFIGHVETGIRFESEDEAKASAQADYERRIRSALTPAPDPVADVSRVADLEAKLERLIEDRARFPDRPDWVGDMIGAHYGNMESRIRSAESYTEKYRMRLSSAERKIDELTAVLENIATWGNSDHCTKLRSFAKAALTKGGE